MHGHIVNIPGFHASFPGALFFGNNAEFGQVIGVFANFFNFFMWYLKKDRKKHRFDGLLVIRDISAYCQGNVYLMLTSINVCGLIARFSRLVLRCMVPSAGVVGRV